MLQIYNTLSRRKERFKPIKPGQVGIYVCGITTYDYCHLGHARMLVAFDVIVRYLRASGFKVIYVRNITDIDDKIIRRAQELGEPVEALTSKFISVMHEDEQALGVLPPDQEPRATEHVAEITGMIAALLEKGFAYQSAAGDVYYAVRQFPAYALLSRRNPDELAAGARVEIDEAKRDPRDFTLWKQAKAGEPSWDSPWGQGRPGWHIECSAMSTHCLGDSFDIHGGGSDLIFPHHENEIAQSEAATGRKFANVWMHNGPLRLDSEKMSKSLGNVATIREALQDCPAEVIRYFLLASHYRSPVNYSSASLEEAHGALERFYNALKGLRPEEAAEAAPALGASAFEERFRRAMDDDFNTPEAIAVLFDLAREINRRRPEDEEQACTLAALLVKLGDILGILQGSPEDFLRTGERGLEADAIQALIERRNQARAERNWAQADAIRAELKDSGVVLEDKGGVTTWRVER